MLVHVTTRAWRDAVAAQLDAGTRFAGAWATGRPARAWRTAFAAPDGALHVLGCAPTGGRVPTICDLVPAADWDEREAHDLHGLGFDGRESLRALAAHPEDLAAWTTPVEGDGVHQVAVGPIHAGVIESGHFRFHLVGERILAMDPRLFYKHRGLERAAEGADASAGLGYAQRACAACAVANTVAYAHAVEDATGLEPDWALRRARTLLLELKRLYNHLHDIGAICAGVGYAPGTMAFATLKDRAQGLNAALVAHRFLFDTVAVRAGTFALDAAALPRGDHPRSLALRHVDAGSCNGCEHELGLATTPRYDLQRFGLDIVASPRHADALLVTGPVTTRMAHALRIAYDAMPEPRLVAALGDCALGCGILGDRAEIAGALEDILPVDIRIPGCPPTPNAIAEHLLAGLDALATP